MQMQTIEAPSRDGVARGEIWRTRSCESWRGQLPVMARSNMTIAIRPITRQQMRGTARFEPARQGFAALERGPFRPRPGVRYDVYAASPVRCFYQNWQRSDCRVSNATAGHPGRCLHGLELRVKVTEGAGSNRPPELGGLSDETTDESASSVSVDNMPPSDVPYLRRLDAQGPVGDNDHQPDLGGPDRRIVDVVHVRHRRGVSSQKPYGIAEGAQFFAVDGRVHDV